MKKPSIRKQMVIIFLVTMLVTLAVITIINHFFLGDFYRWRKVDSINATYEAIEAEADELDIGGKDSQVPDDIRRLAENYNLEIIVTDSDFKSYVSTAGMPLDLAVRLFGYYTGYSLDKSDVIRESENYTIQQTNDMKFKSSYIEMWGQLSNGCHFLIRSPLESIDMAVSVSNLFYVGVGLAATVLAVIVIFFLSKRISEPIVELTGLSERMASLDFDAHYKGHVNNEIDELGANFNKMSDELAKNISELKSANAELAQDVEKKTKIDEMRKEFLNNVSHELKTPLALISGYAEGLKDNIAESPEDREFYCDVIIDEANKMNTMVKKLLTLNQLEFGNDQTQMERFDIAALIRGVIAGMKLLAEDKGAEIIFEEEGEVFVWGDEFKIEEVVTNYVSNAINHVEGEMKIIIRLARTDGSVEVSVFNTGKIIPEEDIDKVWDKFYKVDKARTRAYGGSGIGLSIVKAIMDAHGQKCWAENFSNGVAFYFTLSR